MVAMKRNSRNVPPNSYVAIQVMDHHTFQYIVTDRGLTELDEAAIWLWGPQRIFR